MARSFEDAVNFNGQAEPRAKRSDALLRELYHEEVDPPFRVPGLGGVKLLLVGSLLSVVVFAGTSLFKYNNFISLREAVYASNGNLNGAIQRRTNLFSNMINLTLSHAELEHEVFSYAALMRSQGTKGAADPMSASKGADDALLGVGTAASILEEKGTPMSAEQLSTEMSKGGAMTALAGAASMPSSLGRLMAVAERYPEIRSSETYQLMMTSLVEIEDRIATRRLEWHAAMQEYNSSITGWPWALLAHFTGFQRMEYFQTDERMASAPVFSSKVYKSTVASVEKKGKNSAVLNDAMKSGEGANEEQENKDALKQKMESKDAQNKKSENEDEPFISGLINKVSSLFNENENEQGMP